MPAAALARRSDGDEPHTIPGLKLWLDARRPRNYDCLHLPGSAGYYASTPDSVATSITGDIDIRCKVALASWTPAAANGLWAKWGSSAHSIGSYVATSGVIVTFFSTTGTDSINAISTVGTGIANGAVKWVRFTRVAATGVSKYYLSDDGTAWTQLGTDVSTTTGNIFDSDAAFVMGAGASNGSTPAQGRFYRAQIRNNVLDDGTGIVFDADFTNKGYTFTEDSSNHATVTCNGRAPLADGDSLSIWCDLGGAGNDVAQATAAKKPLWHATGVQFDGVDDYLSAVTSLAQPATVYLVLKRGTLDGFLFDGGASKAVFYTPGSYEAISGGVSLSSGIAVNTTSYRVLTGVFNGASSYAGVDGAGASGNAGTSSWTAFSLGASGDGTYASSPSIACALVYQGAHDAATRKRIERYLGRQWNVTVAQ